MKRSLPRNRSRITKPGLHPIVRKWQCCLAASGLWLSALTSLAQLSSNLITLGHLNAGAVGTNQNDKLVWANGALFATNSGYLSMSYAPSGVAAGYYATTIPTLTALSSTTLPAGLPPGLGSFLKVKLTLVSGPAGGELGFWLTGATAPSYSLSPGDSTALIDLSDPLTAGDPGEDPFGHIHGRRYTGTQLGDYILGLEIYDTSVNGLNGGPIHVPSDPLYVNFRAVPEPVTAAVVGLGLTGFWLTRFNRRRASRS